MKKVLRCKVAPTQPISSCQAAKSPHSALAGECVGETALLRVKIGKVLTLLRISKVKQEKLQSKLPQAVEHYAKFGIHQWNVGRFQWAMYNVLVLDYLLGDTKRGIRIDHRPCWELRSKPMGHLKLQRIDKRAICDC